MWMKSLCNRGLYVMNIMGVHLSKSRIARQILFLSALSAQETGLCQFQTEYDVPTIHWICHFVIWETRGLVRKFPYWVPNVPFAVTSLPRSYCEPEFHLGTLKRLREAVRYNSQEIAVFCVTSHKHTPVLPCYVQSMLAEHHIHRWIRRKLPSHGSIRVFPVCCPKDALRGKAFDDEERSKFTPHSNFCRYTKRTTVGASSLWNNLIQTEVFWFRRDQYVMKVISVFWFHSKSPGSSWSDFVEEHMGPLPYIRSVSVH